MGRRRVKRIEPSFFQLVFDSSSLINIERRRQVKRLRKRRKELVLPEKVADEVKQKRGPLKTLLDSYPSLVALLTQQEEDRYLQIRVQQGIDDGEAAAIALALSRRLPLVVDDKKGRSKAQNHDVECLSSDEFLP